MILVTAAIVIFSMVSMLGRGLMLDLIIHRDSGDGPHRKSIRNTDSRQVRFMFAIISVGAIVVGIYLALRFLLPAVRQFIDEFFVTKLQNSLTRSGRDGSGNPQSDSS